MYYQDVYKRQDNDYEVDKKKHFTRFGCNFPDYRDARCCSRTCLLYTSYKVWLYQLSSLISDQHLDNMYAGYTDTVSYTHLDVYKRQGVAACDGPAV